MKSLQKVLYSEDFAARHKTTPEAFTRNRKLPFATLICLLTNFVKSSYQNELDHFFKALGQLQVAKRIVTKPALTQARKKLKHEAFIELNQHLIHRSEEQLRLKRWHGLRLVGIDGTTCRLPRIDEISEHFGVWNVRKGAPCPSARISQLFDTLNKLSISAVITPKNIDEREHAYELFHNLLPDDLVLMDRGYPAFWLFKVIFSMQAGFCARISDQWKIVRDFLNSGLPDQLVELEPSISSIKICKERDLCTKPMTVRLVRVELDSGETEVLITSLTDSKRYKTKDFKRLYHRRWPIEEDYKTMKCWIELENFTGKTVHSIYQDFYAKVFAKNLTSILCFPVQGHLERKGKRRKHPHQVNFAQALSKMKNVIPLLFQRPFEVMLQLIIDLHDVFKKTTEPVRPGRKFPRNHKASVRRYYPNYKAIA